MHFSPTRAPRKARFPARACPDHPACPCPHSPTLSSQRSQWPLRFPDATANGLPAPLPRLPFAGPSLPPTCASRTRPKTALPALLPRPPICRPTPSDLRFPRATENGLPTLLPRPPFAGPSPSPTCASSARPKTARPRSCRVCPSQTRSPSTGASPCDREQIAHTLAASAIRRPSPPPTCASPPHATANVPARGFSQAPGDGLRPSGMALAVPPRHVGQKMFKFYNSLKIALSPVDSGMHACYNVPSGYPVVCATPVLLPTDSKKDSGSVSVDVMPPISDRPGKAANGRRSPPCLSGG